MQRQWNDKIFAATAAEFETLALEVFHFQYAHNTLYKQYVDALQVSPLSVESLSQIPFLPIRFFKSHAVQTCVSEPAVIFESSGTTGSIPSRHYVKDASLYRESFLHGFELFYGPVKDWCIIGLLPSYLERENSSLVYMVNAMIGLSSHAESGFYLHDHDKLFSVLQKLEKKKQKTILIGVTFGLLDFAEKYSLPLEHTIIMETGGMKGRRKEMIREEVHDLLKKAFDLPAVHSEYGMTELLSQAYSKGDGIFSCPPWMKIVLRDEEDPLSIQPPIDHHQLTVSDRGQTGAINVIDLANVYSCSFIATEDAGKLNRDGSFEVLGRMDNSDLRGCSLMAVN